jgi:hypothetical protein
MLKMHIRMPHIMVPACHCKIIEVELKFPFLTIHTQKPHIMVPACGREMLDHGITVSFFYDRHTFSPHIMVPA